MTRDEARQAFATAITALQGSYPGGIQVELPDFVLQDPADRAPHVKVRIVYADAYQAALGRGVKRHRAIGNLVLEVYTNKGLGSKIANDILQHFYPTLHMSDAYNGVHTNGARFVPDREKDSWVITAAVIPFWFDDNM